MRAVRLICALVLATALAALPVSAAFAMADAASAEAGMTAPDHDCTCCKPEKTETCFVKCCVQALIVHSEEATRPAPARFGEVATPTLPALALGPDPPPPRS
jgi:hypothetical protein